MSLRSLVRYVFTVFVLYNELLNPRCLVCCVHIGFDSADPDLGSLRQARSLRSTVAKSRPVGVHGPRVGADARPGPGATPPTGPPSPATEGRPRRPAAAPGPPAPARARRPAARCRSWTGSRWSWATRTRATSSKEFSTWTAGSRSPSRRSFSARDRWARFSATYPIDVLLGLKSLCNVYKVQVSTVDHLVRK